MQVKRQLRYAVSTKRSLKVLVGNQITLMMNICVMSQFPVLTVQLKRSILK